MLAATAEVISELGYEGMSVARITGRAGVSRRTFYDLFTDREDCFLAVFEEAVAHAAMVAREAVVGQERWRERVRAGLSALLGFIGEEPVLGSLVVVDALGAGPRVLACRAGWLATLNRVVDEGRTEVKGGAPPPPLTAEGVVGAVLSVLHARLSEGPPPRRLVSLLNPLMSMIVLPYLGQAAAAAELVRETPRVSRRARPRIRDPLEGLDMRLTYRTLRVLAVVAEQGGLGANLSNRQVADAAGVSDQGQISKLLGRLAYIGLIQNTGQGHTHGEANAWSLTRKGMEVEEAIRAQTGARA